jgi:hypothetical protein
VRELKTPNSVLDAMPICPNLEQHIMADAGFDRNHGGQGDESFAEKVMQVQKQNTLVSSPELCNLEDGKV